MGRAIAAVTVSAAESGQLDSTAPRGVYRISLARRARIVSARHLRTVGDIPPSPELVLNFRGPDSHLRSGTDFQENEIRLDAARSSIAPEHHYAHLASAANLDFAAAFPLSATTTWKCTRLCPQLRQKLKFTSHGG